MENLKKSSVDFFKSLTIEPLIFLYSFGLCITAGAQITTNLLIWKFCRLELNHPDDVCDNLASANHTDVEVDVQTHVNNFLMKSQWIGSAPIIFFSCISGALSDEFGRKPLIFFPLLGLVVSFVLNIVNCVFINDLPVEFFYLDNVYAFFGGYAVLYLGTYTFMTNITDAEERAQRLARLDAFEVFGYVTGTLLSPVVLKSLGYNGNYGISAGILVVAIIYLLLFVKEPLKKTTTGPGEHRSLIHLAVVTPYKGMKSLIVKKRSGMIKLLVLLQLGCFVIYWLVIETNVLKYQNYKTLAVCC